MSVEAMTWAWKQDLPVGQKLLLLAVADHAGEGGVCWPSQAHLARKTGFSERQVRNNLNDLVKAGVLSVEIRGGDGSGRKSNVYTMTWQPANISGWATGNLEQGNRQPTSGSPPYIYKPSIEPSSIGHLTFGFDAFWQAYPKKAKKKPASEIWKRKRLDDKAELLIADIANRLRNDRRWLGGFIPDPTTYLNQERWTDEIELQKEQGNGRRDGRQKTFDEIQADLRSTAERLARDGEAGEGHRTLEADPLSGSVVASY